MLFLEGVREILTLCRRYYQHILHLDDKTYFRSTSIDMVYPSKLVQYISKYNDRLMVKSHNILLTDILIEK